jgi:hypothetical protein
MRSLIYVMSALAVLALAFWAYRENYATQAALREVRTLQGQIADLREALSIQRAEWAYLNRPDRLRELATINFDRLGLLPLQPEQFGQPQDVGYPAAQFPALSGTVDVIGDSAVPLEQTP